MNDAVIKSPNNIEKIVLKYIKFMGPEIFFKSQSNEFPIFLKGLLIILRKKKKF